MTTQKADRVSPVLIGGLIGGVASGIPFLNCLNMCCCLLYVLGGGIAGALYAKQSAELKVFPSIGDGAIVGALAGVVSGIVAGLLGAILNLAFGLTPDPEEIQQRLDQIPDLEPQMREALEQIMTMFSGAGGIFISIVMGVVFATLFSLLGGMIGIAIFRKKQDEGAAPQG